MKCERCSSEMDFFQDNSTQGWDCSECGWSIVTSNIGAIGSDITIYSIYIHKMDEINTNHIKLISQLANVNFLEAKKILQLDKSFICKMNAQDTKLAASKLKEVSISYEIWPLFNH